MKEAMTEIYAGCWVRIANSNRVYSKLEVRQNWVCMYIGQADDSTPAPFGKIECVKYWDNFGDSYQKIYHLGNSSEILPTNWLLI